jgi:tRNA nucleotidyltransferase (CCA-adding enzyme)
MEILQKNRVYVEMWKAFSEKKPSRFFTTLRDTDLLEPLFPEVFALIGQTQPVKWHAEGDAFDHTMLVMDKTAENRFDADHVFFALCHDLGKGLTPKHLLPKHYGHELAGVPVVENLCNRLGISGATKKRALIVTEHHMNVHRIHEMKPTTIVNKFSKYRYEDLEVLADMSHMDSLGKISEEDHGPYTNHILFKTMMCMQYYSLTQDFTENEIKSMSVEKIKSEIFNRKVAYIKNIKKFKNNV